MKNKLLTLSLFLLTTASVAWATVHNVAVTSNQFTPASLTINQGDTVLWTNMSGFHNVNGSTSTYPNNPVGFINGSASSAMWTYQIVFNTPGTYDYQCDPHAAGGMVGTVAVNAVSMSTPCSQPYFSEYIEGSGNNKGFEIYNPTSGPLDLSTYRVMLSGNGGSFTNSFDLSGTIASGAVYTVTTDQADPTMLAVADTALPFPSVAHFNGDDALFLMDTVTGDTLDIIGVVGVDPGSSWPVGTGSTSNNTLVRNATVTMGEKDWAVGATQWTVNPSNTFSFLGAHVSSCVVAPCTQPYFSEYIEGSGNNKGFEVYNPTSGPLDLSTYRVMLSGNGGSFTNSLDLSGTIASGAVYTVTTDQADPTMLAVADTALPFPSVAHFNGDDALFLMDTVTGDTLDIIGVVGVDPGSSWPVGTGTTANNTLVRNANVTNGETDWAIGATQWTVNPSNTFSFLGSHSSNCIVVTTPTVNLDFSSITVSENVGSVTVTLTTNPVSSTQETINLQAALGSNVTIPGDGTLLPVPNLATGLFDLVLPAGEDSTSFIISIVDDAILEGNETLFVNLIGTTPGLITGTNTTFELIVLDNDAFIPTYPIATVTTNDANGEPDSLNVYCKVSGTVFTGDFDGNNGYSFYIHDGTGGINVFNFNDVPGYPTPTIGDSIRVIGEIDFFNGLTEIVPDSIVVISAGNTTVSPTLVFDLDETTESELIRLNGFYLADPTQWPATGSNSNVDITNGQDTLVMRIDRDTDVDGTTAPIAYFDLIGVGGQFDNSSPYNEGYQIFPRDSTDIIPIMLPTLGITEVMPSSTLAAPIDGDWFEVTNFGTTAVDAQNFSWDDDGRNAGIHNITNAVTIAAGESVIFLQAATADVPAWLTSWGQTNSGLVVLNEGNQFDNGFSALSSGGDEVNLYDAEFRLISSVAYGAALVTPGTSIEFDNDGNLTGVSVIGTNGAYASNDVEVGSPGNLPSDISIAEFLAASFNIYPNPAQAEFSLEGYGNMPKAITITNVNGQTVMQLNSSNNRVNVNVTNLSPGVYFVRLAVDGQTATKKLVIK
jgi:plastocyanin